jgi:cytochrome c-type biogenesis protein CcmF
VEKRESLKSWTILLAILAFGFSLIGTFIVRSGIVTSVHSFASDPTRGLFILALLAVFIGGALLLYSVRAGALEARGVFSMVSRESALVVNNILLAVAAVVVFIGTIWPLAAEMFFDRKLSVGAPFFEQAFTPFMVGLAALLPIGAMLPWKRAKLGRVLRLLAPGFVLAVVVALFIWTLQSSKTMLGPIGFLLGVWLVSGALVDLFSRTGRGAIGARLVRLTRLPRADWGRVAAHAGLGIVIAGISGLMAWQVEDIRVARIGEPFEVAGYQVELTDVSQSEGPNYLTTMGQIELRKDGALVARLYPEKRVYPVQAMPTTEADIRNGFWGDLYLVIGDAQEGGGWAVRTFIKPFANWIWFGALLMGLGGLLSLSDRRYRVAAGAVKPKVSGGVPAE